VKGGTEIDNSERRGGKIGTPSSSEKGRRKQYGEGIKKEKRGALVSQNRRREGEKEEEERTGRSSMFYQISKIGKCQGP